MEFDSGELHLMMVACGNATVESRQRGFVHQAKAFSDLMEKIRLELREHDHRSFEAEQMNANDANYPA